MEIAIVADIDLSRLKGDTIRTIALAQGLAESGHDVELIVPDSEIILPILEKYTSEVTITPIEGSSFSGRFFDIIDRKRMLSRAAKGSKADWIQIETSFDAGRHALSGLRRYIVDVHGLAFSEIAFSHGPLYWRNPPLVCSLMEGLGVKRAVHVVAVSQSMKEYIRHRWKVSEDRITVIPNGYFAENVSKYQHTSFETGRVTFVGALARWAMVERVLGAAYELQDAPLSFSVVGDGPQRAELEAYVRSHGMENVEFTGFLSHDEVYHRIATSEIVVAPFPDILALQVACPIKLVEYGALRKPIVLNPVSDLARRLAEEGGAMTPRDNSTQSFAASVLVLSKNQEQRDRVASIGYGICRNFTWSAIAKSLADMYEGLSG